MCDIYIILLEYVIYTFLIRSCMNGEIYFCNTTFNYINLRLSPIFNNNTWKRTFYISIYVLSINTGYFKNIINVEYLCFTKKNIFFLVNHQITVFTYNMSLVLMWTEELIINKLIIKIRETLYQCTVTALQLWMKSYLHSRRRKVCV